MLRVSVTKTLGLCTKIIVVLLKVLCKTHKLCDKMRAFNIEAGYTSNYCSLQMYIQNMP